MSKDLENKKVFSNEQDLTERLALVLPPNYVMRLSKTEFLGESIDIRTYIILYLADLVLTEKIQNISDITSFKKLVKFRVEQIKKEIPYREKILKEREKTLKEVFAKSITAKERAKIEREIIKLPFSEQLELAKLDSDYLNDRNGKHYKDLQPKEVYRLAFASYRVLSVNHALDKSDIENLENFRYANDTNRKKADSLVKDGIGYIREYFLNKLGKSDIETITENDYLVSVTAHDTELTKYNFKNYSIREAFNTFFVKKVATYTEKSNLTAKNTELLKVKERIKTKDYLNDIELNELKAKESDLIKDIKKQNIVKISILGKDNKPLFNDFVKCVNANPNKVAIYNAPNNTIITEYKNTNVFLTQHMSEFYNDNEYTRAFLDKIFSKVYRNRESKRPNYINFSRSELEAIFPNVDKQNTIQEVKKHLDIIRDLTINAVYFNKNSKENITLESVSILDYSSYNNESGLSLVVGIEISKWVLSSLYKNESLRLQNVKPKYNKLVNVITDNTKEHNKGEWTISELGETIGTPTLDYIKTTLERHYTTYLINPTEKALNELKNIGFDIVGFNKQELKTEKKIREARVKITSKNKK